MAIMEKKENLSYQIYKKLKEKILRLEFPPHYQLKESELCRLFGVSRTPLRASLQLLATDSLVEISSGKTTIVKDLSLDEFRDIFQLRDALEHLSIELAVYNWSEPQMIAMKENLLKQFLCVKEQKDDIFEFLTLDQEFHILIGKMSHNLMLLEDIEKINSLYLRYHYYSTFRCRMMVAYIQHKEIAEAIEKRNPNLAKLKLSSHLDSLKTNILIGLAKKEKM